MLRNTYPVVQYAKEMTSYLLKLWGGNANDTMFVFWTHQSIHQLVSQLPLVSNS